MKPERLTETIACPHCGWLIPARRLSEKEVRIMELSAAQWSIAEIAREVKMMPRGVKAARRRIWQILGVSNTEQFVLYWQCELFQIGLRELGLLGR